MLKIQKLPKYMSPSSLMQAIKNPNTFYLLRLNNNPIARDPQGKAAAVGSAFDIQIKKQLWSEEIDKDKEAIYAQDLHGSIESEDMREEAMNIGKRILNQYMLGARNFTNFKQVEAWATFKKEEVPIFGKLDATCLVQSNGSELEVPFDWKCSGFGSASGQSPKQGYFMQFDGMKIKPAHAKYKPDITFREINPEWAIQLCFYGWSLGLKAPFPARIDQLTITKTGKIKTSIFHAWIDGLTEECILNSLKEVWSELEDGSYINRVTNINRSFAWCASRQESWMDKIEFDLVNKKLRKG